jgi:hypothetical protein
MFFKLVLSTIAAATAVAKDIGTVGTVTSQVSMQKLASGSELVALMSEPAYVDPIYLVSLYGDTSYDQGYDAGVLVGQQFYENYHVSLLMYVTNNAQLLTAMLCISQFL